MWKKNQLNPVEPYGTHERTLTAAISIPDVEFFVH